MSENTGTALVRAGDHIVDRVSILDVYQYVMPSYEADTHRVYNGYMVRCPTDEHVDNNPSCMLNDKYGSWICFGCGARGGKFKMIIAAGKAKDMYEAARFIEGAIGLTYERKPQPNMKPEHMRGPDVLLEERITGNYPYEDETGNLLYRIIRYDGTPAFPGGRPKRFEILSVGPDGKLVRNAKHHRKVPYLLPDLAANEKSDRPRAVAILEGEGKANIMRRMGFLATSGLGGANWEWPIPWVRFFAQAPYIFMFTDSDKSGRRAAQARATLLRRPDRPAIVIDLAPNRNDGYDIINWLREARERGLKLHEAKTEIENIMRARAAAESP